MLTQKHLKNNDNHYDLEMIYQTTSGEKIYRGENSIVVKLPKNRNIITTSHANGGYQENLQAIFNHQPGKNAKGHCARDLEGGSVEAYIRIHAQRLGLDPDKTAGMITAANMKNVAIKSISFRDLEVTAIVTAGIKKNGGRAGDPANWYEEDGTSVYVGGTINTIILINSHLPPQTLTRVIMTATEAKTVAIQELMAPSRYSNGIATGSGTDQISVISNMESPNVFIWAGKHSKVGELIARCVIDATTEALAKQTNLTPDSQRDMLVRVNRFKKSEEEFWVGATELELGYNYDQFIKDLRIFSQNPIVVTMIVSLLHILDEIEWGLVPEFTGKKVAISIMKSLPELLNSNANPSFSILINEQDPILNNWIRVCCWCLKNGRSL